MNNFYMPGFGMFSIMFTIVFVLIVFTITSSLVKEFKQQRKDNNSPRLSVDATVVAKREDVRIYHRSERTHTRSSTTYYVTFQVASGDRMELCLTGSEYGLLVEGDQGTLTFQGSRFLSFERR